MAYKKWRINIGGFVGEENPKVAKMQSERWLKHITKTHDAERAKGIANAKPNFFTCNPSISEQIEILKEAKFKEVELLYKRYCYGAYYGIKS